MTFLNDLRSVVNKSNIKVVSQRLNSYKIIDLIGEDKITISTTPFLFFEASRSTVRLDAIGGDRLTVLVSDSMRAVTLTVSPTAVTPGESATYTCRCLQCNFYTSPIKVVYNICRFCEAIPKPLFTRIKGDRPQVTLKYQLIRLHI